MTDIRDLLADSDWTGLPASAAMDYADWLAGKRMDDVAERRRYTDSEAGNEELIRVDLRLWPEMRAKMLEMERRYME